MAEVIHNVTQEFWQPPVPAMATLQAVAEEPITPAPALNEACERCATEYLVGARFCHACGAPRFQVAPAKQPSYLSAVNSLARGVSSLGSAVGSIRWNKLHVPAWFEYLHFHRIKSWIGLPTGSLIAFLVGVGCVVWAIGVSLVFKPQNFIDFEAIQMWRIELLLAATASFVAGILLKKPSDRE